MPTRMHTGPGQAATSRSMTAPTVRPAQRPEARPASTDLRRPASTDLKTGGAVGLRVPLAGELGGQHVDLLDVRRGAEQLARLRDRAAQVSLPAAVTGEDVEDPESRRVDLDGKPCCRVRLGLGQGLRARQEGGQLLL